jgi:2-polyprenyl-6-methoxyphenol hydroxylase-like FAD-dependent oxidoreductase
MEVDVEVGCTTDVLIVGAGAAGLTLAIDLARRGVAFRLIDRLERPFAGSRGKGIQPRSQEVFEDLGVLDRLVAIGGTYPVQRTYADDGTHEDLVVVESLPGTPAEPYHLALMVPQFLTERVLRERLSELGGQVEFGCELRGFSQDMESVTATLSTGETVHAAYLVGTDGGRSTVRKALGIDFPGKTLGVRAVVADLVVEGLSRDAWHRWGEGDMARQISMCPLAGTDLFQLQAPVPLEGDVDVSPEGLARMLRERTGREIIVRSLAWGSVFAMNARLADRYRQGRVFLAGDAAHAHPPTGGQGLNTSVQDAYNLGWKLASVLDGGPEMLLESYEEERRPVAAQMLGLSTRLLDAAKAGIMRRGREVHQLDLGYPESSLSLEAPERHGGILAGDRAPDAPMMGAGGQPVRLFELMRGPHWLAIGYDAQGRAPLAPRRGLHIHEIANGGDIRDVHGHFAAAYRLNPGSWILIRPDGYVGAIVEAEGRERLESYVPMP